MGRTKFGQTLAITTLPSLSTLCDAVLVYSYCGDNIGHKCETVVFCGGLCCRRNNFILAQRRIVVQHVATYLGRWLKQAICCTQFSTNRLRWICEKL